MPEDKSQKNSNEIPPEKMRLTKSPLNVDLSYRPEIWSEEILQTILLQTSMGWDIPNIFHEGTGRYMSGKSGWPSIQDFYIMLENDEVFANKYYAAVGKKFAHLADNIVHVVTSMDPGLAKLLISQIRWNAERLSPRYAQDITKVNLDLSNARVMAAVLPPKKEVGDGNK